MAQTPQNGHGSPSLDVASSLCSQPAMKAASSAVHSVSSTAVGTAAARGASGRDSGGGGSSLVKVSFVIAAVWCSAESARVWESRRAFFLARSDARGELLRSATLARCLCTRLLRAKGACVFRLKTARATSLTGPLCGWVVCLFNNLSRRNQRSNAVAGSRSKTLCGACCELALRRPLARVDLTTPHHVQPNRKRPGLTLYHRSPRNPRASLQNLQRLWYSLRRRLYARHDAARRSRSAPRAPSARASPRPPLESRRNKGLPKAKRLPDAAAPPPRKKMKQSTAMLLGMLTSKMKQIEDMSTSARAIALTASTAGTGILMFTKARSDVASGVTGRLHEQAAAAAEYLVWSDRSACVRAGLDHGSIDEACWLDLVGEAQMITYQKVLRGRRYWSPANMFRWIPSYSIVEIHVREELTKVLKANKLRVAWDAREASCARVERKLEKLRGAAATSVFIAFFEKKRGEQRCGVEGGGGAYGR